MPNFERILCVEDDPDIQVVIQVALEMVGGFGVKLCASGQEALDNVAGFQPDLILLDVMLPGMDGPATLGAMRRLPGVASLPVVFMTAKVQPDEVAHLLSLGAVAVIAKPFDPMTLARELRALWRQVHAG
ncbi:MAG: response regulator [Gallionellaceae bacterium]|nr:response regulator [Gallionellaceae bacterium]